MFGFFKKILGKQSRITSKGKPVKGTPVRHSRQARLGLEELTPRVLPSASVMSLAAPAACSHALTAPTSTGGTTAADAGAKGPGAHTGGDACGHGAMGATFAANLSNTSGATGSAQFAVTAGKLTVQVLGAAASTTLDVALNGTSVGSLTTDASGNGKTTITQAAGAILAGSTITVGDLSGTFAQIQFTVPLTGTTGSGSATFNSQKNSLSVSVKGAAASTTYNVTVDSATVGQVTTNAAGSGKAKITPSTAIQSGSTIAISDTAGNPAILQGTLA